MLNCIVLGSGRSGTSMVAGTLAQAGYFMGANPLPATDANPKGYFETREVEALNEKIVRDMQRRGNWIRRARRILPIKQQPDFDSYGTARWLASIPFWQSPRVRDDEQLQVQIKAIARKQKPFCLKDPRFSYTLPAWRPHLENTVYICVFRHPTATVRSIQKEVRNASYLSGLRISDGQLYSMWVSMYLHVLLKHRLHGDWLFVHYEQLFEADTVQKIASFTQSNPDGSFPDRRLHRTKSTDGKLSFVANRVYRTLCQLANYS